MNNSAKIAKNYIFNLSYQMLSFIIPLITTPYVSRVLTETEIGQYSYTHSIVTYFILCGTIGLNLYGQREIAYRQNDINNQRKIFSELLILRLITISIAIIVYLITIRMFPKYSFVFMIQLLDVIAAGIDISWFFQGREEFKRTVSIQAGVKILGTIFIFLLVHNPSDLPIYVMCLSLPTLIGNALMWLYIPFIFKNTVYIPIQCFKHLKYAMLLFIPQVAIEVYTVLDKTMIGAITGSDGQVGFYEQAQKIVKTSLVVVTSLSTVMMPRVANVIMTEGTKKIHGIIEKSFRIVFFLAIPIMFGLLIVADPLVIWFMGERYLPSAQLIKCICPVVLFIGLASVTGNQILIPMKKQNTYTLSVVCGAGVNVIVNALLIPRYASIGASIATVMAECVVTIIQFIAIKKDFNIGKILLGSLNYWLSGIIMFVILLQTKNFFERPFFEVIGQALIGICVYLVVLCILRDKLVKSFKEKKWGK